MHRVIVGFGLLALGAVTACGGEESGDPAGTGGVGTGGSSANTGGSSAETGGATSGTGAVTSGAGTDTSGTGEGNVFPDGENVKACFGQCPRGECDDDGFFADVSCEAAYPVPVDSTSSYCGSRNVSYCLEVENGDMFGVRCTAGEAEVFFCPSECGTSTTDGLECG